MNIEQRTLGRTGLTVTVLGLGGAAIAVWDYPPESQNRTRLRLFRQRSIWVSP